MVHHLIKETDQKDICPYCGKELKKELWDSKFHMEFHYKTLKCECGKEVRRKVDFISCGSKDDTTSVSIDGIVRKVEDIKVVEKK